jgi:hypothetical protein
MARGYGRRSVVGPNAAVSTVRCVLTSYDDFPIHQASVPIANSATGDANQYDRYFFNGYSRDGQVYFGAAMGLYPNRHVADAAFCVVVDGVQHSVFRSQRAPADRRDATDARPHQGRGDRAAAHPATDGGRAGARAACRAHVRPGARRGHRGSALLPTRRQPHVLRLHPSHAVRLMDGLAGGRRRAPRSGCRPVLGFPRPIVGRAAHR